MEIREDGVLKFLVNYHLGHARIYKSREEQIISSLALLVPVFRMCETKENLLEIVRKNKNCIYDIKRYIEEVDEFSPMDKWRRYKSWDIFDYHYGITKLPVGAEELSKIYNRRKDTVKGNSARIVAKINRRLRSEVIGEKSKTNLLKIPVLLRRE